MRLITISYNEFSCCFIAQPWEGVFAVVVVFYSVLGIRHHVLGIFLADKFIPWIDYVTLKGKNDDS